VLTGFELYLKRNSKKFDDYLKTFFGEGSHPDMRRYLYGPLARYSANSGKRHRPLICLLACQAVGGDPERARTAAAAIEHFHTAALIHDDIEDSSLTRRGEPCMHIREGEGWPSTPAISRCHRHGHGGRRFRSWTTRPNSESSTNSWR
jgi:geranylgeranyl diphosphate synthase type I